MALNMMLPNEIIHKNVHVLLSRELCGLQKKMKEKIFFFEKRKMPRSYMDKHQNSSGFLWLVGL